MTQEPGLQPDARRTFFVIGALFIIGGAIWVFQFADARESILGVLVGAAISGVISWFFIWRYYKRAGDDLRREADELRKETAELQRLQNIMLEGMAQAGWIKLIHDEFGRPARFHIVPPLHDATTIGATEVATVKVIPEAQSEDD